MIYSYSGKSFPIKITGLLLLLLGCFRTLAQYDPPPIVLTDTVYAGDTLVMYWKKGTSDRYQHSMSFKHYDLSVHQFIKVIEVGTGRKDSSLIKVPISERGWGNGRYYPSETRTNVNCDSDKYVDLGMDPDCYSVFSHYEATVSSSFYVVHPEYPNDFDMPLYLDLKMKDTVNAGDSLVISLELSDATSGIDPASIELVIEDKNENLRKINSFAEEEGRFQARSGIGEFDTGWWIVRSLNFSDRAGFSKRQFPIDSFFVYSSNPDTVPPEIISISTCAHHDPTLDAAGRRILYLEVVDHGSGISGKSFPGGRGQRGVTRVEKNVYDLYGMLVSPEKVYDDWTYLERNLYSIEYDVEWSAEDGPIGTFLYLVDLAGNETRLYIMGDELNFESAIPENIIAGDSLEFAVVPIINENAYPSPAIWFNDSTMTFSLQQIGSSGYLFENIPIRVTKEDDDRYFQTKQHLPEETPHGTYLLTIDILPGGANFYGYFPWEVLSSNPDTIQVMGPLTSHDGGFAIFPNPTDGKITLTSQQQSVEEIELIDLAGGLVYIKSPRPAGKVELDLRFLKPGVYLMRVRAGDTRWEEKVILRE